ncbi:MAG: phytanoyl-CoA dioxygenase family protein [Pseudomonadota bacterium]
MSLVDGHRQTRYVAAEALPEPTPLPLPPLTEDIGEAQSHLTEYGMCLLKNALSPAEVATLRDKLTAQAAAERALGELAPPGAHAARQGISNLVNKGREYLDLVEREEADALAGYMLGKNFLVSSITGCVYNAPMHEPQVLHRDQGQVPAEAPFPAACNLFWLLDDVTPERGSTWVVPGSHRWPAEHLVHPPERELAVQITAPAGTCFSWDGRLWHGFGANLEGHPRRHIANFYCLPWMRQQENWGVTCLQEVLDEASPKLRARLGMRTYGTLGMMSGTAVEGETASLGNYEVAIPEYVIGEGARLHPIKRVRRES